MARSHMDPDHIIMRPQHFGPLLTYLLLSSHKTGAVFEQTLLGVVKADDRLLELRCGRVDVSLSHEELVLSKGGRSRASRRRWWRASSLAAATAGAIQLRHLEDCCRIAGRHASVPRILQVVAWKQLLGTRRQRLLHEKAVHLAARSVRLLAGFSGATLRVHAPYGSKGGKHQAVEVIPTCLGALQLQRRLQGGKGVETLIFPVIRRVGRQRDGVGLPGCRVRVRLQR